MRMGRFGKYTAVSFAVLMLVLTAFLGGVLFDQAVNWTSWLRVAPDPSPDVGAHVDEVRRLLEREALNPSSEESMTAGSIQGLLDSLDDPYAAFFDEQHFEYFSEQTEGEFFGIGINIIERDGEVHIVSVIEDTPAEEAGLMPEDLIVSIDGDARERWDLDEVVTRVRGPEGTEVELGIRRDGENGLLSFTITRAQIDIPNVMARFVDGDVGHVRLLTFNARSAESWPRRFANSRRRALSRSFSTYVTTPEGC